MIKLLTIMAFSLASLFGGDRQHTISSIEVRGNWIYLFDENGRQYKSLPVSTAGDVMGYSSSFFVSRKGNWIHLYDAEGKMYKTLAISTVGEVIGVAGDCFTSRKGNWIYTWDSQGKQQHIRPARR